MPLRSSLFSGAITRRRRRRGRGGDPAGDAATCSRCGIRRRCPGLISLARGAAAWLPSSALRERLSQRVCVCVSQPVCWGKSDSRVDGGRRRWRGGENNVTLSMSELAWVQDSGAKEQGVPTWKRRKEWEKKNTSVIMCLCTKASLRACLLYVSTLLGLFHLPGKPEWPSWEWNVP